MNIYFCGIGGVGLGPLAEIALDAGYTVSGTDGTASLMTQQLTNRGVQISPDQSGAFLQQVHAAIPVDWFVYTSALPADHPELTLARSLNIRVSKRDELLAHIIKEKNLKLIAVAGTHGKSSTTGLAVWTMKRLGIPVSYSVGTTMSFAPSGHFDPKSKYFIYECDEFDRNFLYFHPHLSLIPSIDYDHPDTYPKESDYLDAFRQFIRQSDFTILWDHDAKKMGQLENTWQLGDHDVAGVALPGDHVRRNASLVVKAMEKLGITGDFATVINEFPGVDRRFQKLADNVYSDYGHHPTEIKATLQLASELNKDVILIYQPHQNVRQHEIKNMYTDCFENASDIYWLPTYLTREDPSLPVLTPEQLTEHVTNRSSIHKAELNDALWQVVLAGRLGDSLVLFMGAGSIDEWARQKLAQENK